MSSLSSKFVGCVKARINGRADGFPADDALLQSPALARQAGVPEEVIASASADVLGLPYVERLDQRPASQEFVIRVPIAFARHHGLIGLAGENGRMTVAFCDLRRWPQLQAVARLFSKSVEPILAPEAEIQRAINAAYQAQSGQAERVIEQLDSEELTGELERIRNNEDLLDVASRAPVIKLVNLLLLEAVKRRASDVHLHPYEDRLIVRFRVDGLLYDVFEPPVSLHQEIISRIKVMAGMNIAERRLAQDGRATVEVGDRVVDLRIATLPTSFGERAVIRLLDKSLRLYELGELGMPTQVLGAFRTLIQHDHGLVLVTGPTGSGKTTTLYAALQELNAKETNILTLEDPIEYRLEGISQTQVNERKGMTFASGLRHVLRQDPDVIMVGEIRDQETARMAIQSALTGHLVFSTLHTNDAPGAVTRMLDLGIEPYLVASSLLGVQAQRLVRRICMQCMTSFEPSAEDRERWNLPDEGNGPLLHRGAGCEACMQTGYHDRVGVFELLVVTEAIRGLILQREKSSSIKAIGVSDGMTTLRTDGVAKAFQGVTTMSEVVRVTGRDDY